MTFTVAAFYRFTPFAEPQALCAPVRRAAEAPLEEATEIEAAK